jgi:hypothetical protein
VHLEIAVKILIMLYRVLEYISPIRKTTAAATLFLIFRVIPSVPFLTALLEAVRVLSLMRSE